MANVKIVFNPINVTSPVILRVEYSDQPGASVFSTTFNPPHTQRNFTVTDLLPKMCRFFFWESPDGLTLGTLLGSADIDASIAEDAILEVLEFVIDRGSDNDPVGGATSYLNPILAGASLATPGAPVNTTTGAVYQVFQRGVGPKLSSELANRADGGFDLIGDAFNTQDVWIVNIYRRVIGTSSASAASGSRFKQTIVKTADFTIDETLYNSKILLNGTGPVLTVNFPALRSIPGQKFFLFSTHGGAQNYAHIIFEANEGFFYKGALVSEFFMPVGETLELEIFQAGADATSNQADLSDYQGNAATRGRVVKDYVLPVHRPGYVLADGTQYSKGTHPGLYAFAEAALAAGVACDPPTWAASQVIDGRTVYPNKSRYAINTDPTDPYIIVPDLRNLTEKNLKLDVNPDGDRVSDVPGGFQIQKIMDHTHTTVNQGRTKRGSGGDPNEAWTAPGGSNFGTPFPVVTGGISGGIGGTSQRVDNYGVIPLITL